MPKTPDACIRHQQVGVEGRGVGGIAQTGLNTLRAIRRS